MTRTLFEAALSRTTTNPQGASQCRKKYLTHANRSNSRIRSFKIKKNGVAESEYEFTFFEMTKKRFFARQLLQAGKPVQRTALSLQLAREANSYLKSATPKK